MLNTVQLMGRLTADPELKTTPNGVSACTVSLLLKEITPKITSVK